MDIDNSRLKASPRDSAAMAMAMLSISSLALTLTVHRSSGGSPARPISLELAQLNPLAWLLVACLVAVVAVLARRVAVRGYGIRALLLAFAVPCLGTISATAPQAPLHTAAFVAIVIGSGAWFFLMAAEMGNQGLLAASAVIAVALPVLGVFAPGVAQKLFVLYALSAANIVFYSLDDMGTRISW